MATLLVLEHTHIEGLEAVIKRFAEITDDMKRKPYDLLDFYDAKFDRDLIDFEVQIHDLETQLQSFINSAFEHITNTEQALNLLQQFHTVLQRDSLKSDLQDKYMVIFHNYSFDLEAVQTILNLEPLVIARRRDDQHVGTVVLGIDLEVVRRMITQHDRRKRPERLAELDLQVHHALHLR